MQNATNSAAEEAMANIRDAIRLVIESRLAVGDPIPTPKLVSVTPG